MCVERIKYGMWKGTYGKKKKKHPYKNQNHLRQHGPANWKEEEVEIEQAFGLVNFKPISLTLPFRAYHFNQEQ